MIDAKKLLLQYLKPLNYVQTNKTIISVRYEYLEPLHSWQTND